MELGEASLKVNLASIGYTQASGLEMGVNAMSMFAGTTSTDLEEGRVLQLLNMVTPEELIDNDDYEGTPTNSIISSFKLTNFSEILEDIQEECQKYGQILEMKIPRPSGGSRQSAGVGKIYIKYDTPESAKKALQSLAGRKFADRTVVTTYFSEVSLFVSPALVCMLIIFTGELRGQCLVKTISVPFSWTMATSRWASKFFIQRRMEEGRLLLSCFGLEYAETGKIPANPGFECA